MKIVNFIIGSVVIIMSVFCLLDPGSPKNKLMDILFCLFLFFLGGLFILPFVLDRIEEKVGERPLGKYTELISNISYSIIPLYIVWLIAIINKNSFVYTIAVIVTAVCIGMIIKDIPRLAGIKKTIRKAFVDFSKDFKDSFVSSAEQETSSSELPGWRYPKEDIDLKVYDPDSMPPRPDIGIFEAVRKGDLDMVKANIKAGVDLNIWDDREYYMPLHIAVINGRKDLVKCLLDGNAYINQPTSDGRHNALTLAIEHNHADLAEYLKSRGANLDLPRRSHL